MGKARTERWNEKRAEILDAGRLILNRDGLSGLRLSQVAKGTGLRRPSIAYYFGNAEELAGALYEDALGQLEDRIRLAAQEPTPRARAALLLDQELDHHARERMGKAVRRPQLGEVRALSMDRRRKLGRRYYDLMQFVSRMLGIDSEGLSLMERLGPAHILMESIFWLPAWIDEFEDWMFPRVRDAMVSTLFEGFRSDPYSGGMLRLAEPVGDVSRSTVDREAYLRAASRLICDFGVQGIGIDQIAAELNVTKGSFYHHHNEKADLIEACFAHSEMRLGKLQHEASKREVNHHDRVSWVLRSLVSNQLDGRFPLLRTSALPSLSQQPRAKIIAKSRRSFRWFASEISAAINGGAAQSIDPFVSAQMIGAVANAAYDLGRHYGDQIGVEDADRFTRMLECGIEACGEA